MSNVSNISATTPAPFDADQFVQAGAPALGIALTVAERGVVSVQMARIHALAQLVMDHPLAMEDELAPRFEP